MPNDYKCLLMTRWEVKRANMLPSDEPVHTCSLIRNYTVLNNGANGTTKYWILGNNVCHL